MTTEPKHGLKRYDLNKLLGVMLEYDDGYYVLASEADALIAAKDEEIAGLRLDAERYRWLREQKSQYDRVVAVEVTPSPMSFTFLVLDRLDAAVDAARSKEEGA